MKILITGAGGPAAISFFNAIKDQFDGDIFMADMDRFSSGLYLVPAKNRVLVPAGDSNNFARCILNYCIEQTIDLVIPTVDCELAPLAAMSDEFKQQSITLALSSESSLLTCFDKYTLMNTLRNDISLTPYSLYDQNFNPKSFGFPMVVKPRSGSGSRDINIVHNHQNLDGIPKDGSYMVQRLLPGTEYSVDVFISHKPEIIASVVRERIKVDSGIAVIGRTLINHDLSQLAGKIALQIGIRYAANIQFKLDNLNKPKLLEINPRFPGTMPLTVAAGINMPMLCIQQAQGDTLPSSLNYREIAMVRHWQETFMDSSQFNHIEHASF